MGKSWFKQFEALIWAATLALTSLGYVYASFATKEYVNQKHDGVMKVLEKIDSAVQKIDDRTYELARGKK